MGLIVGRSKSCCVFYSRRNIFYIICGVFRRHREKERSSYELRHPRCSRRMHALFRPCWPPSCDVFGECFPLQTFDACLVDSNIGVRVAALKAACSFVQELIAGDRPTAHLRLNRPSLTPSPCLRFRALSQSSALVTKGFTSCSQPHRKSDASHQ